ncbi:MAG: hypothetical protein ACTSX2_00005, partial [Candidatus Thorarchaeota archaeon]
RNQSGYKQFRADNLLDWVRQVTGFDCSCHVQITADPDNPDVIEAYVYHHDSPTGEYRKLQRMKSCVAILYDEDQAIDEVGLIAVEIDDDLHAFAWDLFKNDFGYTDLSDQAHIIIEEEK